MSGPPPEAPTPPKNADLQHEILAAFAGTLPPVPLKPLYLIALFFVALAMVVLPLIYLALIAAAGWGVYWHATSNTWLFEQGKAGILGYAAPLVVGITAILFMIKPLFAPRAAERPPLSVEREQEPLLFAFVERLCELVGSPKPHEIRLDCEVNASASLRRGLFSSFSHGLVLTIGLPLIAGLSLRQLAGVLAHEFGHFGQRGGMRLTYVIRAVSFWFARVVYQRDAWDERLRAWCEIDLRIGFMFYLARGLVWLTRKLLWLLMVVGNAISCFMLRQMEYDADRYEAHLVGSDVHEATSRRMHELMMAEQGAQVDLREFWSEKRLADSVPHLVLANLKQIPHELREELWHKVEEEKTGFFDTHPCTRDRLQNARREHAPGVFTHDALAEVLFQDFAATCRQVSLQLYQQLLDEEVRQEYLHPVELLVKQQGKTVAELDAQYRYFQGIASLLLRPLQLPGELGQPLSSEEARPLLEAARQRLLEGRQAYAQAYQASDELDTRLLHVAVAEAVLQAKLKFDPQVFQLAEASAAGIRSAREAASLEQERLAKSISALEQTTAKRLLTALQLLQHPEMQTALEEGEASLATATLLLAILERISALEPHLLALRHAHAALGLLAEQAEGYSANRELRSAIRQQAGVIHAELCHLLGAFGELPYPLEHGQEAITIRQHLAGVVPDIDDIGALHEFAPHVHHKINRLYVQLLGRLATLAERVEEHLGLPPLPAPPAPESNEASDDQRG